MRYGFVVPSGGPRVFADLAARADRHGWDGVFTYEVVWGQQAWVTLGAAAMVTERVKLGTLLTPVPRWRPWDLASAVLTVDQLSGGRAVMIVGLGAVHANWLAFEPDEGRRVRAEKLDEGLAIYDGLMRGQPFGYEGKHFSAAPLNEMIPDPPVRRPRPPVWVVGARSTRGRRQPSLERAARWDGVLPAIGDNKEEGGGRARLDAFASLVAEVTDLRAEQGLGDEPFDVVVEGDSSGEFVQLDPPDPKAWEAAGATWWIESWWSRAGAEHLPEIRRRIEAGPPGK